MLSGKYKISDRYKIQIDWEKVTGCTDAFDALQQKAWMAQGEAERPERNSFKAHVLQEEAAALDLLLDKLRKEINDRFRKLWNDGYFETNNIDPEELKFAHGGTYTRDFYDETCGLNTIYEIN